MEWLHDTLYKQKYLCGIYSANFMGLNAKLWTLIPEKAKKKNKYIFFHDQKYYLAANLISCKLVHSLKIRTLNCHQHFYFYHVYSIYIASICFWLTKIIEMNWRPATTHSYRWSEETTNKKGQRIDTCIYM